jgi:hypothetical protein
LEMERERPRFGAGDLPLRDGVLDFLRGVVWRAGVRPDDFLAGLRPVDLERPMLMSNDQDVWLMLGLWKSTSGKEKTNLYT